VCSHGFGNCLSMRTVDSVYPTVQTRSSIFIGSVLHLKHSFKSPPMPSLRSALTTSPKSVELCDPFSWSVEQTSPCEQPQMDGSLARYIVGGGANTFRCPIPILLGCGSVFSISEARCASSRIAVHQRTRHQVRSLPNWHREWLASGELVDRRRATKAPTAQQW
jgi:hypothetical protein